MKLKVNAKELKGAVAWATKLLRKTTAKWENNPYAGVILSASEGKVRVRATDLGAVATRYVPADVQDADGVLVLDPKPFKRYLTKMGRRKGTTLELDGDTWCANGSRIKLEPITTDIDELPDFGKYGPSNGTSMEVSMEDLQLGNVVKFTATDTNRFVLESVLFEILPDSVRLVGADGFKLVKLGQDGDPVASSLIDRGYVMLMCSLKGKATLTMDEERFSVATEDSTIEGVLTEGKFPDYNQVIPVAHNHSVTVNTKDLKEAAETMLAVDDSMCRIMVLKIDGNEMVLTNLNESCQATIDAEWDSEEPFKIACNSKYLLNILALHGDTTTIFLQTPSKPLFFKQEGLVCVLMPMHIKV